MILPRAITLLSQRYGGRAAPQAFLELAQEHFLAWMAGEGLFDADAVLFKGGTALRKFQFGLDGRFSTDLDFVVVDRAYAEHVLDALSAGIVFDGVSFVLTKVDREALKGEWVASAERVEGTSLPARLDFSLRLPLHPAIHPQRASIPGVERRFLGFEPVAVPLVATVENAAEKLARFRRVPLARDLYDLAHLAPSLRDRLDEVREATAWKVFFDVVVERQPGSRRPFRAGLEYASGALSQLRDMDELGLTVGSRPDLASMLALVQATYGRMGPPLGETELRLARCLERDRYWAEQQYEARRKQLQDSRSP